MFLYLKEFIKDLVPPLIWRFFSNIRKYKIAESFVESDIIFEGNMELFLELIKNCNVYGEYGCGQSTVWMARNTKCKILAVDSSDIWVNRVQKRIDKLKDPERIKLIYANCGTISHFGYPKDYSARFSYKNYLNSIWDYEIKPDLVLIDGRFRVASFLTSLLRSIPGTKILFDDYTKRTQYHLVEEFLTPKIKTSRQALFIRPDKLNEEKIISEINNFTFVKE